MPPTAKRVLCVGNREDICELITTWLSIDGSEAVTAHCGDSGWRDRAIEAGCVECVGKPLDFSKLEELIDRVSGG